ncbi:MAG: hypothetical protein AAF802_21770 [Planctomycetota bacterium]
MKSKIIDWLASLIVDEWPLPGWCKRRLESNASVSDAACRSRRIEAMLRGQTVADQPELQPTSEVVTRPALSRVVSFCVLTVAASVLLAIGIRMSSVRQPNPVEGKHIVAGSFDVQPVIATAAAGKTVADGVSKGIKNVASDLIVAGHSISSGFDFGFGRDREVEDPLTK